MTPIRTRRLLIGISAICAVLFSMAGQRGVQAADINNGDFSAGLSGWTTQGAVFDSSTIAVLTDGGSTRSLLYQPIAVPSGTFSLSFDFRNALSAAVPNGAVADTFFASIYFADNVAALDVPAGAFAEAKALFDLDFSGPFNVNGTLSASSKGTDWAKFTAVFNSSHPFLAPVFDLRELNTINNDSAVAIDNVVLQAVPEPQTWVALIGGTAFLVGLQRARREPGAARAWAHRRHTRESMDLTDCDERKFASTRRISPASETRDLSKHKFTTAPSRSTPTVSP